MFLSALDIVIMSLGFVFLIIWIIIFFLSKQYQPMFDVLDEKEFPLKEIYSTGYLIMEKIKYNYKSKKDWKLRNEVEILFDDRYADFYMRVIYAQKVSLTFLVGLLSFVVFGLSGDITAFVVVLMFTGLTFYYFGDATSKKIKKRSQQMISDFSEVVSKLALLTNAGMIMREAWEEVAFAGKSLIYTEMQLSVDDMKNGISEVEAIRQFGVRCTMAEIKKFTSTIMQGMIKGNNELVKMLQDQSKEVWELRKQDVKKQGEKAASKLLFPMCIMFIGILVMILVPIFSNLGSN